MRKLRLAGQRSLMLMGVLMGCVVGVESAKAASGDRQGIELALSKLSLGLMHHQDWEVLMVMSPSLVAQEGSGANPVRDALKNWKRAGACLVSITDLSITLMDNSAVVQGMLWIRCTDSTEIVTPVHLGFQRQGRAWLIVDAEDLFGAMRATIDESRQDELPPVPHAHQDAKQ